MSNNPAEMCGATSGGEACILRPHDGDHVSASGHRW